LINGLRLELTVVDDGVDVGTAFSIVVFCAEIGKGDVASNVNRIILLTLLN
jgi:hypothetical protein